MCTFLALHSSNLQLIPTTAIALLAASGALHPTDIILPLILSSLMAVIAAIVVSKLLQRLPWYRQPLPEIQQEGAAS
jgi:spore maturation protein A